MVASEGSPRGPPGWLMLIGLGALWGATFPISRLGVAGGADPFLLLTLAFALAATVSVPAAALFGGPRPSGRSLLGSAGLGALLIGGINLPLFWGVQYATGSVASIFYAAAPLVSLVVLLALGSAPGAHTRPAAALGLGLVGVTAVALASAGSGIGAPAGLAAFAVGATCQGIGAVLLGRYRPEGERAWGESAQFLGGGSAAAVATLVVPGSHALPLTGPVLGAALYIGVVSMAAGYAVFFRMLAREGAVRANRVTLLNPIVALAVGVVAFGEAFRWPELAGLALVLAALLLLEGPSGPPAPLDEPPREGLLPVRRRRYLLGRSSTRTS